MHKSVSWEKLAISTAKNYLQFGFKYLVDLIVSFSQKKIK